MTAELVRPNLDALIAEQAVAQAEKHQVRLLWEYDSIMFPGQRFVPPRGSAVADLVKPLAERDAKPISLEGVLEGMSKERAGEPVRWVDMCGGRAMAMRQTASKPHLGQKVRMTSIDLFDDGLSGISDDNIKLFEQVAPGISDPDAAPVFIRDNAETVRLSEPADIITCIEGLQYLNDPLRAMTNWYNQLADGGIMVIATEHRWAAYISYDSDLFDHTTPITPITHLLEDLPKHGINFGATYESDGAKGYRPELEPTDTRTLIIQKKSGTELRLARPLAGGSVGYRSYKETWYEDPTEELPRAIEIVSNRMPSNLGSSAITAALSKS
jgi:hypothetical protein